jgi:glycosyltransferase involved in cell wall biosynthesis
MPLRKAAVAVAPLLYGAGVQNKVLEAMACGTPVVAMSQAISALSVQPGAECLVADTAPTLAAAILSLLHDEDLRARMGAAGRRYVEDNHNWNAIIAHLENIYQRNTVDVQQPTTQPGSAPGELRHSGRSVPGVGANTATAQS